MDTEQFIHKFAAEDVNALALKAAKYPEVDVPYALDQISGRQKAAKKLPKWSVTEGVIYPPHISMEQCSSEYTALYKQQILKRIVGPHYSLVDITGGFGVDFMYMSEDCREAVYVERNAKLCEIVNHNVSVFGRTNTLIINSEAEEFLDKVSNVDVIYADPARRDTLGGRTYAISDCTPDVLKLLTKFLDKSRYVLIKLSPMLDISKTISDFNAIKQCVTEVHIVSVSGECKELLILLSNKIEKDYKVYCVNDNDEFVYTSSEIIPVSIVNNQDISGMYLYEPNASIMKAGCFGNLCLKYGVAAIAANSNVFVSREIIKDFPGRSFHINSITSLNKKELSRSMKGLKKANITIRNFPMSVVELRKRLKLCDGGSTYIFATTLLHGNHVLLLCEKLDNNLQSL